MKKIQYSYLREFGLPVVLVGNESILGWVSIDSDSGKGESVEEFHSYGFACSLFSYWDFW